MTTICAEWSGKLATVTTLGPVSGGGSESVTRRYPWAVVDIVWSGSFETSSGSSFGPGGM